MYPEPWKVKEVSGVGTVEVKQTGSGMAGIFVNGQLKEQSHDSGYILGRYSSMAGREIK